MQKITKYLCGIIQQAAKITNKKFNVYDKDEFGDLVTDIDREVENFLIDKLTNKYPEFDIVSEEFNPEKNLSSNCFVIDPIDGTINFASGLPLWGMQIAAIKDGETVASVIYLPRMNELYSADCDGAFLNGERLEIAPNNFSQKQIYSITGNTFPLVLQKGKNINSRHFRCLNSGSMTFAWVAAGRLNGYCLCDDKKWDYLPGMYLVKMAGGYIKDEPGKHIAATNQEMIDFFDSLFVQPVEEKPVTKKKPATAKK